MYVKPQAKIQAELWQTQPKPKPLWPNIVDQIVLIHESPCFNAHCAFLFHFNIYCIVQFSGCSNWVLRGEMWCILLSLVYSVHSLAAAKYYMGHAICSQRCIDSTAILVSLPLHVNQYKLKLNDNMMKKKEQLVDEGWCSW